MIASAIQWRERAELHRPADELTISREARKLAAQGLTEFDIGAALKLDRATVRRMLAGELTTLEIRACR